jgi:hypothetical protein
MLKRTLPLLVVTIALAVLTPAASALQGGANRLPGFRAFSWALPNHLTAGVGAGGSNYIQIDVSNVGAAPSSGPVIVIDTLPPGITYTGAELDFLGHGGTSQPEPWACTGTSIVTCTSTEPVAGSQTKPIDLELAVAAGVSGRFSNAVSVSGGGALATARASSPIEVGPTQASFGFSTFEAWATNPDGTTDTQAGSHPYETTVSYSLKTVREFEEGNPGDIDRPAGSETESVTVKLPPGLIGDPRAVAECQRKQFDSGSCPADTQVGVDTVLLGDLGWVDYALYNLVPPPGHPAQFAFNIVGVKTFLDASVRSDGDYGITETVNDIAQRDILLNQAVIWGVPSDPSHDAERCTAAGDLTESCGHAGDGSETPFLTLPASCEGPLPFSIETVGWLGSAFQASDSFQYKDEAGQTVGLNGCGHLSAAPTISVAPDTSHADTPAGLTVDVKVPQEGLLDQEGVATADLKNTTVTLPAGLVINPGQAAGLTACQASEDGVGRQGPPSCPSPSKVGTVAITTPLLPDKLEGDVYVLQSNPPNLQLLVAASADGVDLKLVGDVHLDEATGRLTATFSNTPQLPFTDFLLSFSGGAQAALATPTACGTYATSSDFSPWSAPFSPDTLVDSAFVIDSGAGGGPCPPLPLPFAPSLTAGATTDQAGGFTDFSLLLQRADDQQRVSTLSFRTPPGLLGMISKVPLCDEADANAGTCLAASQIGHTVVAAGPGPYPLVVPQPGQPPAPIYLTAGYRGAPYGLSIVVPLHVGPFVLETQVVRARIEVDPHTAQLTVTTDPLPQIIDGIPTDLRTINAVIDREGFMFNPTNCNPQAFSGTAFGKPPPGVGEPDETAAISSHFQVGSCQSLRFAPDFKVSTSGRTSKAGGASLTARILYPTTPPGNNQASSQANIASVKVDLPRQLPSRLTTLQKACTAAQFNANPAGCPAASVIGHARVLTPLLPVPVEGPAYFVSHGGEAFPSLTMVLQGYGVTIDLVGSTFISKAGITSSTFKTVPDVPISSFELTLPEGRYSALAANLPARAKGSFCGQKLAMPTAFTAQNGAVIHESTKITVTSCAKAKKIKKQKKHKKKK